MSQTLTQQRNDHARIIIANAGGEMKATIDESVPPLERLSAA